MNIEVNANVNGNFNLSIHYSCLIFIFNNDNISGSNISYYHFNRIKNVQTG